MRRRVRTMQRAAEFENQNSALHALHAYKRSSLTLIFTLLLLILPAALAEGQTVTSTVSTGINPQAVVVNPVTNKIYVANQGSNNVTVIDGATNNTTTVATGSTPVAVAVNPVTNKIYVANASSNNVTVIDGATNNTANRRGR